VRQKNKKPIAFGNRLQSNPKILVESPTPKGVVDIPYQKYEKMAILMKEVISFLNC